MQKPKKLIILGAGASAELDKMATKRDVREYYYKTIIALGSITAIVGGIIIAILH